MNTEEAAEVLRQYNQWRQPDLPDLKTPDPKQITEAINVAIEALDHLPDAGKKVGINNCPTCNGYGYTAEHDPMSTDEIGQHDCFGCPIQVQCEDCMGTGRVNNIPEVGNKPEPVTNCHGLEERAANLIRYQSKYAFSEIQEEVIAGFMADFALQFGRECFEAAREQMYVETYGGVDKYSEFTDYIAQIGKEEPK